MVPRHRKIAAALLWSHIHAAAGSSRYFHMQTAARSAEDLGVRPATMGAMTRLGFVESHHWSDGTYYTLTEKGAITLLAGTST